MNNGEIQPIPYQNIAKQSDLEPGKIMEAGSVHDFFLHVAGVISGESYPSVQIVNSEFPHFQGIIHFPTVDSVVAESASKKHSHYGPLGRSRVLTLPSDGSWMSKKAPIQRDCLGRQTAVNFLIATQFFSSGREDRVDQVINEALLCPDKEYGFWVQIRRPKISEILRNIENGNGFSQVLRDGLQQIYPKGLPLFGRRR